MKPASASGRGLGTSVTVRLPAALRWAPSWLLASSFTSPAVQLSLEATVAAAPVAGVVPSGAPATVTATPGSGLARVHCVTTPGKKEAVAQVCVACGP